MDFTLAEREAKDLRIRAVLGQMPRIAFHRILDDLSSPRPGVYRIGTLSIQGISQGDTPTTLPAEQISICAPIQEVPMFSLSTAKYV